MRRQAVGDVQPSAWWKAAPSLLTAVRLLLLPLICVLWFATNQAGALLLYGVAALSDVLDGRLARRLGTTSGFGALFDIISDVVLLVSLLVLLGWQGVVPMWFFGGPLFVAVLFFMTSERGSPRYDPVGKHYGTFLFAVVGLLLCRPPDVICSVLCSLTIALSLVVILRRRRFIKSGETAA